MTSQIESFFALTVSRIPERAKKNSEYYVGDYYDHAGITIRINDSEIKSTPSMNVLGIQFVSKLTWAEQVNKSINKSRKKLHAINLPKKYFMSIQLKGLLTLNYYSVRYYNSEI